MEEHFGIQVNTPLIFQKVPIELTPLSSHFFYYRLKIWDVKRKAICLALVREFTTEPHENFPQFSGFAAAFAMKFAKIH